MIARFGVTAAITLCAASAGAGQPRSVPPVTGAFETLARDVIVLSPGEFIHGFRDPSGWISSESHPPLFRLRAFLESGTWRTADVLPLLKHANPRVRTLALVALYSTDDAKLLPAIVALVDDPAPTFPAAQPHAAPRSMKIPMILKEQTVGEIATAEMLTRLARWRQQLRSASVGF